MAGSGWGTSDAKGAWHAMRAFNTRNLQVQKGEPLPSAWQVPQNVNYLKEHYGPDCVKFLSPATRGKQLASNKTRDDENWVPIHKEPASAKGRRAKV